MARGERETRTLFLALFLGTSRREIGLVPAGSSPWKFVAEQVVVDGEIDEWGISVALV